MATLTREVCEGDVGEERKRKGRETWKRQEGKVGGRERVERKKVGRGGEPEPTLLLLAKNPITNNAPAAVCIMYNTIRYLLKAEADNTAGPVYYVLYVLFIYYL